MGYHDLRCIYKFKRDGTLVIKIKGETVLNHTSGGPRYNETCIRRGSVVIKGRYAVKDGKISSFIEDKDVETIDEEFRPSYEDVTHFGSIYQSNARLGKSVFLRYKLLSCRLLWDWDEVPYELTDKTLTIGERLVLR